MKHPSIVLRTGVHAYRGGYYVAWPSTWLTALVVAYESAHDVGDTLVGAALVAVDIVEGAEEAFFVELGGYLVVQFGMDGP